MNVASGRNTQRHKNSQWTIHTNIDGSTSYEGASLAVLLDLRDELQQLNRLLHCSNFIAIPNVLREIRRNTTKRSKPKRRRRS